MGGVPSAVGALTEPRQPETFLSNSGSVPLSWLASVVSEKIPAARPQSNHPQTNGDTAININSAGISSGCAGEFSYDFENVSKDVTERCV